MSSENGMYRINISIGLLAGFLVVIFSLNSVFPAERILSANEPLFNAIVYIIVYGYLSGVCVLFFSYLLLRATNLKYNRKDTTSLTPIGFSIYIPPKAARFCFDEGVEMALYAPIGALVVVYFMYFPGWLSSIHPIFLDGLNNFIALILVFMVISISLFRIVDRRLNQSPEAIRCIRGCYNCRFNKGLHKQDERGKLQKKKL